MTKIVSSARRRSMERRKFRERRWTKAAAVVLIVAFGALLLYVAAGDASFLGQAGRPLRLRGRGRDMPWVDPEAQAFNEKSAAVGANHLILVAGHSVIVAGNLEDAETDESVWYLLDYQKGKGLPQAILSHIRAGIAEAATDPMSLLIFTGGETRGQTGPVNEGASYFRVADAMNLWDEPLTNNASAETNVRARTTTEEFARDSFENLMFSICRFKEVTGSYPSKITVVSFTFKKRRFEEMHSAALQWPRAHFHYIGVDPPSTSGFDLSEATEGELENAARPFESDPYGCHTPVLQKKRIDRNPFSRTAPYPLTCPDIRSLLDWCGPALFPKKELPWANL